ncbi:MAG: DUF192 domain-containing protein [Candidatus Aenigmatarchaeota archaeon]|nr:MAG: DUF192 domain-containing protein [Candidatus Aenigmarchaeota archaeon]
MIKNLTKDKILVKRFETADSVGKKTKGLMFRKELAPDSGLLMVFNYDRKHEIWMFGMRFAIDVVFIDKRKRIVDIKHSVKPMGKNPRSWKIYRPKEPCRYVLEVNPGLIEKTKTEIGDVLDFE